MTVAERLQALLKSKGMSVSDVALLAGMTRQQLHRITSGEAKNPGIVTVERIVLAAGGTMKELYTDED